MIRVLRQDRREWAQLGLVVLVYGLVVAPVLHTVVDHGGAGPGLAGVARSEARAHALAHARGALHAHGGWEREAFEARGAQASGDPRGVSAHGAHGATTEHPRQGHAPAHTHGAASVEHLQLLVALAAPFEVPERPVALERPVRVGEVRARAGVALRLTAMPQGP